MFELVCLVLLCCCNVCVVVVVAFACSFVFVVARVCIYYVCVC